MNLNDLQTPMLLLNRRRLTANLAPTSYAGQLHLGLGVSLPPAPVTSPGGEVTRASARARGAMPKSLPESFSEFPPLTVRPGRWVTFRLIVFDFGGTLVDSQNFADLPAALAAASEVSVCG